MARPLRIQYPGAHYHVTCRGNERRRIFLDDDDRNRFLTLLAESLETYKVVLYAYVMMDNHFHIVVKTIRANLSEFMRRFNICYTGWFNYHHRTCGHLYQGRYKAFLVDADKYLLLLSRYVHLNPVRAGRLRKNDREIQWQYVRGYVWSSLPGYIDENKAVNLVDYEMVLKIVGGRRRYRQYLLEGLNKSIENVLSAVRHGVILGDDDFVAHVKSKHVDAGTLRDQPSYRELMEKIIDPDAVLRRVCDVLGVTRKEICQRRGNGVLRGILAEILYRYSGLTLGEIGSILDGIDYGGVHQLRRRLRISMTNNKSTEKKYHAIETAIQKLCLE